MLPNVCYITESGEIKYIPVNDNVIAVFNIEEPGNFYLCSNLNNISTILIDGVDVGLIQSYNFEEIKKYTVEFVLADNTFIADNQFSAIENIYSIIIPNTVKFIGFNAFVHISSLKYVTIGKSVTSIENYALSGVDFLLEVTSLAKTAPKINNLWDDGLMSTVGGITVYYPKDSDYSTWFESEHVHPQEMWEYPELPKNPENPIGLFYNRTAGTPVKIFSGRLLFADPTTITEIKIDGESYLLSDLALDSNSIEEGYIFNSPGHHTVEYVLNKEATEPYEWDSLFLNTDVISISIPNWFTLEMLISRSYYLHDVHFSNITQISELQNCYNLSRITIPEQTESIPSRFFRNCIRLKEITSLSTIAPQLGNAAFGDRIYKIHDTGILRYPKGSDYSTWIAALPSGWTVEELA